MSNVTEPFGTRISIFAPTEPLIVNLPDHLTIRVEGVVPKAFHSKTKLSPPSTI